MSDMWPEQPVETPHDRAERELKWIGVDLSMLGDKATLVGTRGRKVKFICEYCGNEATQPYAWYKRCKYHCCSRECQRLYQTNSIVKTCVICGDEFMVRPCEEKKYSTCEKTSCRRAYKTGENNGNYRHGNSFLHSRRQTTKEYKDWRKQVFERDDFTCQMCGQRGGELNADHIKPWAYFKTLRYDVQNGRTLCVKCHRTTYKDVWKYRNHDKILGVDLDKTLAKNTDFPDFDLLEPIDGAKEAMEKLHREGWKLIIYTARPWHDYEKIENWLDKYNIPHRRIVCGKLFVKWMIDDRNIEFHGDWDKVLKKIG